MSKSLKVFLIGTILPPVHGQSLAFTRFVESIEDETKIVVNTNLEHMSKIEKILSTFSILFTILIKAIFGKYNVVYFTCSRSFLGSIKDVLLINLASLKKVKIVNHLHGSDFYEFLHNSPKWYQKILFYSYRKVDISIVLLDSMKEQFIDFRDMKLEVVSNFYDKELDKQLAKKDKNNIRLVYLSNIMSSKGIFELISAFEELSKEYDNIYLNIAGEFMADDYMSINKIKSKFISKINTINRIKYLGKIFGDDKAKLLQSSDIFILPSCYKSEAFPISILEAMACGNAIVATNYKYLREIVNMENGVLVEPKSVVSLQNGLKSLLQNVEVLKKLQSHNEIEAKEKYSLDRYLKNLNKIVMET